MQALIDNGKYKVTEVLYSAEGYSACLCTDVMVNGGRPVIVNTYSGREYINELLPLFYAVSSKGMKDFIELITSDGSISAVFSYYRGTSFSEYYTLKRGEKRGFEESMQIAENLLRRSLELDLMDDRIAFCALDEHSIALEPSAHLVEFNFRILPLAEPEPDFRGKRLGRLLGRMFPAGKELPDEIEQFVSELCGGKYPSCTSAYSRWREISEAARETHAGYESESYIKYLIRRLKRKKNSSKKQD